MTLAIAPDLNEYTFAIEGLCFEPTATTPLDDSDGWFRLKISSSPGPLISDFVTHEPGFSYATYGIHVGQDDRLTFMGDTGVDIVGHFVDCRTDSPTRGAYVGVTFAPSAYRMLVIPRGVAHSFDNLERVVTRDEPVWHSDRDNPSWNIDNDLVSFSRATSPDDAPTIRPNRYELTREAHRFLSRLSQSLLENPTAYLNRIRVQLGDRESYIVLEPKTWLDDEREIQPHLAIDIAIDGAGLRKNRYALTGGRSWTLVPNTASCVADILELRPSRRSDAMFCHPRTRKLYTFMNAEGAPVRVTMFDARAGSPTEGRLEHVKFTADPRVCLTVPHGVAYRIDTEVPLLVRCEHVTFVDEAEPRTDIPLFGEDLLQRSLGDLTDGWRVSVPTIECPAIVVYELARVEATPA